MLNQINMNMTARNVDVVVDGFLAGGVVIADRDERRQQHRYRQGKQLLTAKLSPCPCPESESERHPSEGHSELWHGTLTGSTATAAIEASPATAFAARQLPAPIWGRLVVLAALSS